MRPVPRTILPRPHLDNILDQMVQYPLTVVRASMGFGKTTAVRTYLQKRKTDSLYLSMLGARNSPAYFWERLTSRVSRRDPVLGNRLVQLGFPENSGESAAIVDLLLDYTFSAPFFLVIDDYHLLECPPVADFLCLLTGAQIPNLHIVLLTREIRLLPEADLIQKHLACSITQRHLQFRPQEVSDYFNMLQIPITPADAQRITQWTGGWISGIYLIARGDPKLLRDNNPSIDELLERNLYHTYSPESRQLLERLAFLDTFTPEMVAEIFDSPDAPGTLQLLLQGNAFLSYNADAHGYQMTDLLREFLQQKAHQNGFDPTDLYRRAGQWFLQQDKRTLAYTYFYRAGALSPILESLNREDFQAAVGSAQFELIRQIFRNVPDSVYYQYPLAALQYIRAQAMVSSGAALQQLDRRLAQMEQVFLAADLPPERQSRILGEIHNIWILVAFNDAHAMVEHAAKAVKYFNGRYSCLVSNDTEFTFGAASLLYTYYNRIGTLKHITGFISQNFHILGQAVQDCGSGSESLVLAEYALETGDLDNVGPYATKALYQARMYHQTDIELCATFTLCRLLLLQGKTDEADHLIAQMCSTAELENNSVLNTTAALCTAYLDCCLGRLERVPGWLCKMADSHGSFLYVGMGFHHVVTCFATLLSGDYLQLEVYCEHFEKGWSIYNNQMGFLYGKIFRAGAQAALHGPEQGAAALCDALDLAVQDNIIFPFAENARTILPLLSYPMIRQRYPITYLDRLTACCRQYLSAVSRSSDSTIQLTGRETEILRLLAKGLRHDEIAPQLFISVPTVRYHIKNIYQKLGVNNKLSALNKARELHLLP